ncbi:hypothetical protein PQC38_gp049 [Aeromonas phage BUCT695]|uniref:hypothetical protein n=1 Tax=Aeromonas phage BUCT695 TaxID=2908630 RepID=UPI0023296609|nr:hypothetical protein PQC38_gp049 [Aeromonas phage BUCT695]UIW10525.1 hypothetical protein [Aeromonas phage BUCT695]
MYFVLCNQNVYGVCQNAEDVFALFRKVEETLRKSTIHNNEINRHYNGDVDAWISSRMYGYQIVHTDKTNVFDAVRGLGYSMIRYDYNAPNKSGGKGCYVAVDGFKIVTDQFLEITETKYVSSTVVKADVVKKGLKSTGKTVTVSDLGGVRSANPGDYKEAADKMVRVNVFVNNWGTISMAPDSLDNYRVEQQYQSRWTAKLKSE